jgi:hypothetical protein
VVLLLVVALAVVLLLGVVAFVGGGIELLPLGAVGDEVGGVAALKLAPKRSPPLLAEPMQSSELSHQQGDLIVGDALVLLIRSCTHRRQTNSRADESVVLVGLATWPPTQAPVIKALLEKEAS